MSVLPPTRLPRVLHGAAASRALDQRALADGPADRLMERAGLAAVHLLGRRFPAARRVLVLCGGGHNGGDGYVVARLLQQRGYRVACLRAVPVTALRGVPATVAARAAAVPDCPPAQLAAALRDTDLVVDALLGTGLSRPVAADWAAWMQQVQHSGCPVLALDVPSGLCADQGAVRTAVLPATATLSFITLKPGLLTGQGPDVAGELYWDDLGVAPALTAEVAASAWLPDTRDLAAWLPPRRRGGHKGRYGHVGVIGGDHGLGGAAILASQAAAQCGAGKVSALSRPAVRDALLIRQPEVMARVLDDADALSAALTGLDTLVIGPGLGQQPWGRGLWQQLRDNPLPRVLDADALNLLAAGADAPLGLATVLTPHPGEAARLLGCSTGEVEAARFEAVAALAQRYQCTVLLKGVGTLVAAPGQLTALVRAGHPGMASGGMGDVLSGIIGALLAQGLPAFEAAVAGALVHGRAAEAVARRRGERGLLASELLAELPAELNPVSDSHGFLPRHR